MSSLLRDAIVDAKALREAALKNAETTVIDKYSEEVSHTLEQALNKKKQRCRLDLGAPRRLTPWPIPWQTRHGRPYGRPDGRWAMADPMADADETGRRSRGDRSFRRCSPCSYRRIFGKEGENLGHLPARRPVDIEINVDLPLQEAVQSASR